MSAVNVHGHGYWSGPGTSAIDTPGVIHTILGTEPAVWVAPEPHPATCTCVECALCREVTCPACGATVHLGGDGTIGAHFPPAGPLVIGQPVPKLKPLCKGSPVAATTERVQS